MTRIISGRAGSLNLAVPATGTRPTSDRVREAVFSALDARIDFSGLRVLDLYAGSGALGLEAISRGASQATLVEKNKKAAEICRQNASLVLRNLAGNQVSIEVKTQSVKSFLESLSSESPVWDLVFLDPPYDLTEAELSEALAALDGHLAEDAIVVVERSSSSLEPSWPNHLEPERSKRYGDTLVWWAHSR